MRQSFTFSLAINTKLLLIENTFSTKDTIMLYIF